MRLVGAELFYARQTYRQTDTTNLIFAFRHYADAPNKPYFMYTKHIP